MGSSQSRPSPTSDTPRTGLRRRLQPLRRFSTLGRRKKDTPKSGNGRIEGDDIPRIGIASTSTAAPSNTEEVIDQNEVTLTEPVLNIETQPVSDPELARSRTIPPSPAPSIRYPVRRPTSPTRPTPRRYLSISPRPTRSPELRRSLNIPDWNSSVNVCRRRSWVPGEAGPSSNATPITAASTTPTIAPAIEDPIPPESVNTLTTNSNTLTSTDSLPPRSPTPPTLYRTRSEPAFGNPLIPLNEPTSSDDQILRMRVEQTFLGEEVSLLRQQLETSRRELAQAVTDAAAAENNLRELEEQGGAVMMIQGIAQTHLPISRRRLGRWRRDRERRVPFEEQASTIIGLILVASLATANTLLSTERPRPRPNNILETLMGRIQPTRAFAVETLLADPSISNSSDSGSSSRRRRRRSTGTSSEIDNLDMPPEFTQWLNTLQGSIREAMREYVDGTTLPISRTTSAQHGEVERPGTGRRISAPIQRQATLDDLVLDSSIGDTIPQATTPRGPHSPVREASDTLQVPQFHVQPGQISRAQRQTGVTTDANGVRSLSFFRAHVFAAPNDNPNTMVPCLFVGVRSTSQDPATFGEGGQPFNDPPQHMPSSPNGPEREVTPERVGSVARSVVETIPSTNPESVPGQDTSPLVGLDGELLPSVYRSRVGRVPMSSPTGGPAPIAQPTQGQAPRSGQTYDPDRFQGAPSSPNGGTEHSSTVPTVSRTQALRSRLLALSPFSRNQPSSQESERDSFWALERVPQPDPEPEATFIMYVIGGNFPRNHPVLRIPGLITGEPLSDEEMVLMGELLGEAKPPTATAEEVAQSGLRVIKGSEIRALVEGREVIDSSADRCLVCLSDFEEDEDCRILTCRHVFHMECVDEWIKVGRNACPACRTEAVDRKPKPEISTTTTTPNQATRPEAETSAEV